MEIEIPEEQLKKYKQEEEKQKDITKEFDINIENFRNQIEDLQKEKDKLLLK